MIPNFENLKSNYMDLRNIFENDITAIHIAEELKSCDSNCDSIKIKDIMISKDFEVFGIKNDGNIIGYIEIDDLDCGKCEDYIMEFHSSDLISESTPLAHVLPILREKPRIFVLYGNQIKGIITRSDLQKLTVRLFLFGIINILEMQMTRIIKNFYNENEWNNYLTLNRIEYAKRVYDIQKRNNDNIELIDCLTLADKKTIFLKSTIIDNLDYSEESLNTVLGRVERLRNDLAHSRDLNNPKETEYVTWSKIIDLTGEIEKLLENLDDFR